MDKKRIIILDFESAKVYTTEYTEYEDQEDFIIKFSSENNLNLSPSNCQWMIVDTLNITAL